MKNITARELRGRVLHSVSRSFYLSIRLLPEKLRDPIALAYLLARATDTIADTAEVGSDLRMRELARLAAMIQQERAAESLQNFATLQKDRTERALIEAIPSCLQWLSVMEDGDQADIRRVLVSINEGQTLDVQRFGDAGEVRALPSASDLDRYTYLVAGAVGEFWTNICFRHLPNFCWEPRARMNSLGVEYGKGLQLVNVLRDLGADLRAGRSYLPAEELHALGAIPDDLLREPARFQPILRGWRERAERGLTAGVEYACAIRPWRVRLATALPALIGARTLALLRDAGPTVLETRVKVRRAEVRKIIFDAVRRLASPRALREAFRSLSI